MECAAHLQLQSAGMSDLRAPTSVRGAFFWYLHRRLGKWQWRALLAALVAAAVGFAGVVYFTVTKQGATHGHEPPMLAKLMFQSMIAGLAFLVAFALFFWLRSVLKWIAGVVAIVVVGGLIASHFFGTDVDTSSVQQTARNVSDWSWSGGKSLLDALTLNWTGTVSGGLGSFLGLRRPRG